MDSEAISVRTARNAAARRRMGLGVTAHVRREQGSRSKRWTDSAIRTAVERLTGGVPVTRRAYIALRRDEDPNLYPSHNTVLARCPDLFQT